MPDYQKLLQRGHDEPACPVEIQEECGKMRARQRSPSGNAERTLRQFKRGIFLLREGEGHKAIGNTLAAPFILRQCTGILHDGKERRSVNNDKRPSNGK